MSQPESSGSRRGLIVHKGHTGVVASVNFSPDGKSVVSASGDATIRIWDAQGNSPPDAPLNGHTGFIFSVLYSPLGDMIASGSKDKTIRLWDTNTRRQVGQSLQGHTGDINSVAFSPGGDLLASGSDDKTIRLWNTQNRSPASDPFRGHTHWVRSVAFSAVGARVASGSNDRTIRVWDVERRATILGPLEGHADTVRSVNFSPDGNRIASGSSDASLRFWDARTGFTISRPFQGYTSAITSVAFSPNGIYIASASTDRTVRVWDVRAGRQVDGPFEEHTDIVCSVAFSPCGKRIASGSKDNTVMIWSPLSSDFEAETYANSAPENDDAQFAVGEITNQNPALQEMFHQALDYGCTNLSSQFKPGHESCNTMNGGGVADVWTGRLGNGTRVVVRAWRASIIERCNSETMRRAVKDIHTWSRMKHKNIHQLIGVVMPSSQYLGLIAEWMENGNLHEYMHKNPNLDRHQMCVQITLGLASMHQSSMVRHIRSRLNFTLIDRHSTFDKVHGDVKAINVLISSGGVAKLSNFGLSSIAEACLAFSEIASAQTGSVRWVAPELLSVGATKTKQSDIYALGMTMLEVITGNVPYPQCLWDFQVLSQVMQGELPSRPPELKDDEYGDQMWSLLRSCWDKEPNLRPSAKEVLGSLVLISTDYV